MSSNRPYVVLHRPTNEVFLVEASNKSQAVRVIADTIIEAHPANGNEVLDLMRKGVKVINAGEFRNAELDLEKEEGKENA